MDDKELAFLYECSNDEKEDNGGRSMIIKDYSQNKEDVLSLYRAYEDFCKKADVSVNESMRSEAKKIEDEVFNLMILGEAKSGKSTFINAYLGREVVPMDVRQCTSAIIRIKNGETFQLFARTAGGGQTHEQGEKKIHEFLKEHAAISDEYRAIPVTTINNELLIKYQGRKIPEGEIDAFLAAEKGNDFCQLGEDRYNELIRQYIGKEQKNWQKIITEIEISYPLPEAMRGITIIDSPGTGANGSVGNIAEEYLADANAIIFVKSLNGQALESIPFMNFLRNVCKEKQKEALFLAFTRITDCSGRDLERLKEQAFEIYDKDIDKEKILFVDSKMQLFLNQCRVLGTEEKIGAYFTQLEEEKNAFDPASVCWYQSRGDVSKFIAAMEKKSAFGDVCAALEKFARKAHYIQLMNFVENIEQEYRSQKSVFSDSLQIAKEHFHDPSALERSIEEKKKELDGVYNKINNEIDEIYNAYTNNLGGEGKVHQYAEQLKKEYAKTLGNFKNLPDHEINDQTFRQMKKMTMDAIDRSKDVRAQIATDFLEECNERLIHLEESDKLPAEVYRPNFTASDFDEIQKETEKGAIEYKKVKTGVTFKKVEKIAYHSDRKHVRLVEESIRKRLGDEIVQPLINNAVDYINVCRDAYKDKLTERKNALEQEHGRLLKDKEDNEKRKRDIERLERNLDMIKIEQKRMPTVKGVLSNYV